MAAVESVMVLALLAVLATVFAGCGERAVIPSEATMGPSPQFAEPIPALIPTVNIAPAKGWARGATPEAAPGLAVRAYADQPDHPRWLYVLPNGDVLVAETNAPPRPDARKGSKAG